MSPGVVGGATLRHRFGRSRRRADVRMSWGVAKPCRSTSPHRLSAKNDLATSPRAETMSSHVAWRRRGDIVADRDDIATSSRASRGDVATWPSHLAMSPRRGNHSTRRGATSPTAQAMSPCRVCPRDDIATSFGLLATSPPASPGRVRHREEALRHRSMSLGGAKRLQHRCRST